MTSRTYSDILLIIFGALIVAWIWIVVELLTRNLLF